jgi:hypothetical protein
MSRSLARASKPYRPKSTRLVDQVREVPRYHHYSYRTEQTYVGWIVRFVGFSGTRQRAEIRKPENGALSEPSDC